MVYPEINDIFKRFLKSIFPSFVLSVSHSSRLILHRVSRDCYNHPVWGDDSVL